MVPRQKNEANDTLVAPEFLFGTPLPNFAMFLSTWVQKWPKWTQAQSTPKLGLIYLCVTGEFLKHSYEESVSLIIFINFANTDVLWHPHTPLHG